MWGVLGRPQPLTWGWVLAPPVKVVYCCRPLSSQGQNLALTVFCLPYSLDCGTTPKKEPMVDNRYRGTSLIRNCPPLLGPP